ncbi:MAG: peroxide stress protein YaaA [Sphaerospermopsis sp. SIO1G2]|nr:peroxide stress protein YaaA [Sphaerospermopsis sp. SIO1G2]
MLLILSPAKTLDMSPMTRQIRATQPRFLTEASVLVEALQQLSIEEIRTLMGVSENIATLNYERYAAFTTPLSDAHAKPALFSFQGDVYKPLDLDAYDADTLDFATQHLRLLSGLYGVLRPLDYLYPYRLEMGTKLACGEHPHLYAFWGEKVTHALNDDLDASGSDTVLNLASVEYSKVVQPTVLNGRYITVVFKEKRGEDYKVIGVHAKRARGCMVDYVLKHRLLV